MRRSAAVLERLASKLPYSALALCRLVRPRALDSAATAALSSADLTLKTTRQVSPSAAPSDVSRRHPPAPLHSSAASAAAGGFVAVAGTEGGSDARPRLDSHGTCSAAAATASSQDPSAFGTSGGAKPEARRSWRSLPSPPCPPVGTASSPRSSVGAIDPSLPPPPPQPGADHLALGGSRAKEEFRVGAGSLLLPSPPPADGLETAGLWSVAGSDDGDDDVVEEVAWC